MNIAIKFVDFEPIFALKRHVFQQARRNLCKTAALCVSKYSDVVHDVTYDTSLHKGKGKKFEESEKSLPESADVVVIGGGSVGCSTAYHLAKYNAGKVILIEKEQLTAGTTWHTAGILWNLRDGRPLTRMQMHTRELLTRILPEETGYDAGWIETGSIFVTRRKEQLDALEKKGLIGSEYGAKTRMIGVEEISHLHPLMNTEGLLGGLYSPHDGSLDPATLCTSYTKAASKYGAQVFEGCEVTDIKTDEDFLGLKRVVAVETNRGTIKTNNVVNCTGCWAPYIAKMVGLDVPQLTYKHAYVITQGIPGIEKVPHIRDVEAGSYHKRQGDALLFGGYEKEPAVVGLVEKDMAFGLYDMDWEKFEVHMNSAITLVPEIAKVGIRSTVCGPESFTPDGNPLMGESPSIRGFFYGSAFNSGGMMLGGGAGKQLAHWVVDGRPEYDMSVCDINRFSTSQTRHQSWLVGMCHEHFITRYDVHHPNGQRVAGRDMRKTPLHEIHLNNGAFFSCVHGWEIPAYFDSGKKFPLLEYDYFGAYGTKMHEDYQYRDRLGEDCMFEVAEEIETQIKKEAVASYNSVALFDLSHLSKFRLSGTSVDQVVQMLFTSDISKLGIDGVARTLMLDKDGRILSEVVVTKEEEQSYRVSAPSELQEFIMRHLNQYLQDSKSACRCEDVTEEYASLHIYGPKSSELLSDVGAMESSHGHDGIINGKKVKIYRSASENLRYTIHCQSEDLVAVYETLMKSKWQPVLAGIRAMESFMLETDGTSLLHCSLVGSMPREAGLLELCPVGDGREYVGKSAVEYDAKQPQTSKLIKLTAESSKPILPGDVIWRDGIYSGIIERAAFGYKNGKYVLRGFLKPPYGEFITEEFASSGKYTVGRRSHKVPAEMHP